MNSFLCERCGMEILAGQPIAAWTNGAQTQFMHRFPYQCDEKGVEMVRRLEAAFDAFQKEPCD